MSRLFSAIDKIVETLITVSLIALFTLTFGQVILRYVSGFPLIWTEEVARFLLVWFTFLGATIGISRLCHITIAISIQDIQKGRYRPYIKLFLNILLILFFLVLMYKGTELSIRMRHVVATSVPIPMWVVFITVPLNGMLMLILTCSQSVIEIRKAFLGKNRAV